jgi:hypothetical protein
LSASNTPQQQVTELDLASLPSLPNADDFAELTVVVSNDPWGDLTESPEEAYNVYEGTVSYFYPDRQATLILEDRPRTRRAEVIFTLEHYYYYYLRKHLTTNLDLIDLHGEVGLSSPPSFTTRRCAALSLLEIAQNSFAVHHTGISETLIEVSKLGSLAFGLPNNKDYRPSHNYFSHAFPTPKVTKGRDSLTWTM